MPQNEAERFASGYRRFERPLRLRPNFMAQNEPMDSNFVLKDPVCGMAVTHKSFHHLEHQGQTYFFCGTKCKTRFTARMDHYSGQSPTHSPVQDSAAARWSFPDKPGRLLLAGLLLMALVSLGLWLM